MTKTQRMLAAFALAGAAAGLAAPAASAAPLDAAPLSLPDLPAAAPGMPAGAQPSVPEIGARLSQGANQLNQLMTLPDQLSPVIAPVQPLLGLAGAIQ
ncbi:hypothetical protein [Streptomyces sp. C]|uniref:hypothetical protein n=1 Tax=Streptomyces sp. C TaxID=253839 RepID=UPI0001B57CF1|nr:hypothetical protein [Streptomyces sp. C]EFL16408.1 predicted protein [Streptomyces sp. C]